MLALTACEREQGDPAQQVREAPPDSLIVATTRLVVDREGANGHIWQAGFDVSLTPDVVNVTVRVRLVPGPGITRPQLDRLKQRWESVAESYWSDACALAIAGELKTIQLDLQFQDADPHHTVVVRNDAASGVDQLNWGRYASGRVVAHEVGHMLGAWDEYPGGAQEPASLREDPGSIMGGSPGEGAVVAPHHFNLIEAWVRRFSDDVTVVANVAKAG